MGMGRRKPKPAIIPILAVSVIVLAAFNILLWHDLHVVKPDAPVSVVVPANTDMAHDASGDSVPAKTVSFGEPIRIIIPSIKLDAAIEKVALTADGSMGVPKHPLDAAWYASGPRPGETGSAAIAGHVDWWHGATAVFKNLHKVRPGDAIAVRDDKGTVISFFVRETRRFDPAADATEVFTSDDGKAHLNIITCDGVWDTRTKQFSKRLVVFSEKKE